MAKGAGPPPEDPEVPSARKLDRRKKPRGKLPRTEPPRRWSALTSFGVVLCGSTLALTAGSALGLAYSFEKLPDVRQLQTYVPYQTTMIYDDKGRLLAEVHGQQNRVVVPLGAIPKDVRDAVIAAEDVRFYYHRGIDPRGIVRAMLTDLAGGRAEQGASTLTQQLAKNLFLTDSKTIRRKLADAWLAIQIERHYSKDQILELYLNLVYWGHNAYGIEAASETYFNKPVGKLNLAEAALLAGLLGGPERFNPYASRKLARDHQVHVLRNMYQAGFITRGQLQAALTYPLTYPKEPPYKRQQYRAPYFTNYLLEQLLDRFGQAAVYKGGLRVRSTLDLQLQAYAQGLLDDAIARFGKAHHFSQGAIVCLDPRTGAIRVMVGGRSWTQSKFNRVVQALRQPGSSFKPFLYLTAFSQGLTPATIMNDSPQSYPQAGGKWWTPQNYDHERYGDITLRKALEVSNNVIAVKLMNQVGVDNVIETAHRIGIESNLSPDLSLALGTSVVTPLDMASAYGVFAMYGKRTEPIAYTEVTDRSGVVLARQVPHLRQVFAPDPVKVLDNVMQGVIAHGTGYAASIIDRPAAGKTGTTSDFRDAWFVGFTPDLVTAVWLGNDDNSPMTSGSAGGDICAPIWGKFMLQAEHGQPKLDFEAPPARLLAPPPPPPKKPKAASGSASPGVPSTGPSPRGGASPARASGSASP